MLLSPPLAAWPGVSSCASFDSIKASDKHALARCGPTDVDRLIGCLRLESIKVRQLRWTLKGRKHHWLIQQICSGERDLEITLGQKASATASPELVTTGIIGRPANLDDNGEDTDPGDFSVFLTLPEAEAVLGEAWPDLVGARMLEA